MRRRRISPGAIFARVVGAFDLGRDLVEQRIGALGDETAEEPPFLDREPAEKRAVAKDRGQQAPAPRRCAPIAGGPRCRIVRGGGERLVPGFKAQREQTRVGRLWQPVANVGKVSQQLHVSSN